MVGFVQLPDAEGRAGLRERRAQLYALRLVSRGALVESPLQDTDRPSYVSFCFTSHVSGALLLV